MKAKKRLIALITSISILGAAGTAYAANFQSMADIVAGLSGKTVTEVITERAAGKTYGTIANEAGKLEQFKVQMLEQKKAILDLRVQEGTLTQQQADTLYKAIKTNQAACNGTGNAGIGRACGAGFGGGMGCGAGFGQGARLLH